MHDPQAADVASPKRTQELLRKHGLTLKKSLGQNFLTDANILRRIVAAANLDLSKGALEIGPGIGALTQQLAREAGKVVTIEIDRRLLPVLEETLRPYPNVEVVHGDVLALDLNALCRERFAGCGAVSVVANLPYYITTPIIMKLLEEKLDLETIVVMIQKEVADRMSAEPGGKDYGSLSIAVQYYAEPERVATVPASVFIPEPHVDSAVIRLALRRKPPVQVKDEALFFEVVRASFAQRRKTIANNLLAGIFTKADRPVLEALLAECGIDPVRRGETLDIAEFAALANAIWRHKGGGRA